MARLRGRRRPSVPDRRRRGCRSRRATGRGTVRQRVRSRAEARGRGAAAGPSAARDESRSNAQDCRRVHRHGAPARRHRRLGNHGRTTCRRQRRRDASGELGGYRSCTHGTDALVRSDLRCSLQSRGFICGGGARCNGKVACVWVCDCPGRRRHSGVGLANYMFGEPLYAWSSRARTGLPQWCSEAVATFGLLAIIIGCSRRPPHVVPFAVGADITAASWFTASTSFANPAVTIARALTDTVTGIRPSDVSMFVLAQIVGATMATAQFHWLVPPTPTPPVARS